MKGIAISVIDPAEQKLPFEVPMKPKQARFIVGFCVAIVLSTAGLAGDTLGDSLGSVRFEVSGSPEARQHMIRGVKLLIT